MLSVATVKQLLAKQFPQWTDLPISPIVPGGWDHLSFRLGDSFVLRFPRNESYAKQVHKEQHWLPVLAPHLPLPIPEPVAMGKPCLEYPMSWSIYHWLPGETLRPESITDQQVEQLAEFIHALQQVSTHNGPIPGADNFYRGSELTHYDLQTRQAITVLRDHIDSQKAIAIWQQATTSSWAKAPVWVHGDIALGNLLHNTNGLCAVLDFGLLCIGDPACDLSISYRFFSSKQQSTFRDRLDLDETTWLRAKAWAMWKALIVSAGLAETNQQERDSALDTLDKINLIKS